MDEIVSSEWLQANVGKPSRKWGSKYSRIFEAMEAYEKTPTQGALKTVGELTLDWAQSKHKNAKTEEAISAKEEQQLQLNRFLSFLNAKLYALNSKHSRDLLVKLSKDDQDYAKEKAVIWRTINEIADSSIPLLKNTGLHLKAKIVVLKMNLNDKSNGAWGLGTLEVNPILAYHPSELKGLLVHECHHALCLHPGDFTYLDEFAAHMKQYTLTRPRMEEAEMVEIVNTVLDRNYATIVRRWTDSGFRKVTRFADLGDFEVRDNSMVKPASMLRHGCAA